MKTNGSAHWTRREFVKTSALSAAAAALPATGYGFFAQGDDSIKVGVIGCGGRGTGAAIDCIKASPAVKIVALGDVMPDRVDGSRRNLVEHGGKQVQVADDKVFTGFDAYKKVIASGVDVVILATPPGFRPTHFNEAVNAGKHVFFEKPVAVDAAGVRMVIAAGEIARQKKLTVITGTQRRHEKCYLEAMKRVQDGAIGKVIGARCSWNQGGLWHHAHKPEWSDMEWQLRNWLYFTWLSGDHIVEQHVHNIDVCNWAIGATPTKCYGMGGRQVRTAPEFGQIFDHFAVEYEYPDGQVMFSECRQIDGCDGRVDETILGSEGRLLSRSGSAQIGASGIQGALSRGFGGDADFR